MKKYCKLSILATAAILCACGGGGGSDGKGADTPNNGGAAGGGSGANNGGGTQLYYPTNAMVSTHSADQKAAFDLLNTYRSQCGFNTVAQNTNLDTAAAGHATYLVARAPSTSHNQASSESDYTGYDALERAQGAGYDAHKTTEVIAGGMNGSFVEDSTSAIQTPLADVDQSKHLRRLLASVYHLKGAFDELTDVGIAYSKSSNLTQIPGDESYFSVFTMTLANAQSGQVVTPEARTTVNTFPCAGTTGVLPVFYPEVPNPFADSLTTNAKGHPIYMAGPQGDRITAHTVTVKDANSVVVPVTTIDSLTDINSRIAPNEIFVVPLSPLQNNTTYTVSYSITLDTIGAVSKEFSFTTGNQ